MDDESVLNRAGLEIWGVSTLILRTFGSGGFSMGNSSSSDELSSLDSDDDFVWRCNAMGFAGASLGRTRSRTSSVGLAETGFFGACMDVGVDCAGVGMASLKG